MVELRHSFLRWNDIREQAEQFRRRYVLPPDRIPVPIIDIVELELALEVIPIPDLMRKIDIDGFLSKDLSTIYIDHNIYTDPRQENRLRFTFAHEVGHLILHQEEIARCDCRTEEDWIHFREDMSEEELFWFEQQAYEFAGRLLVPPTVLIGELESLREKINLYRSDSEDADEELLIQSVARLVCDKFRVSDQVIAKRIRHENIWHQFK